MLTSADLFLGIAVLENSDKVLLYWFQSCSVNSDPVNDEETLLAIWMQASLRCDVNLITLDRSCKQVL